MLLLFMQDTLTRLLLGELSSRQAVTPQKISQLNQLSVKDYSIQAY